jgi:hypothetical protein
MGLWRLTLHHLRGSEHLLASAWRSGVLLRRRPAGDFGVRGAAQKPPAGRRRHVNLPRHWHVSGGTHLYILAVLLGEEILGVPCDPHRTARNQPSAQLNKPRVF